MPITHTFITKIVQAGAGTGKTESLATEIVTAAKKYFEVNDGQKPHFVATTFTERATSELRERVLQIAERPEFSSPLLLEFVRDQEKLEISTLHGVFAKLLHRYGVLIGLDPEFTIMNSDDEKVALNKVLRKILVADPKIDYLIDQYGFLGLLELMTPLLNQYRLHGESFNPFTQWQELLNKEAKDLLTVLNDISSADISAMSPAAAKTFTLFKTLSASLPRFILDFPKLRMTFLEALTGIRKPSSKGSLEIYKEGIDHIFETKERWSEDTYSFELNLKHDDISKLFINLIKRADLEFNEIKKKQGVLSFSDLEFLMADVLTKYKNVQSQIAESFDYWFVDEYQDTSPLQKNILFSFFKRPWNVYFVGDPQQSIYLFRGADQNVFEETKKMVMAQGGVLEKLETNFRSEPDLLKFMNLLFSPLKPKGEIGNRTLAQIHLHTSDVIENDVILNQVLDWKNNGFDFQDICILVRTNQNAEDVAHFLGQNKIPVYVHTTGGFYDKREILDALSILNFLIATHDDLGFTILARSPWFQIEDEKLLSWAAEAKKGRTCFWEYLIKNQNEFDHYYSLNKLQIALNSLIDKPLSVVFETLLEELGFFELSLVGDSSGKREANLRKLVSQLRQAETRSGFSASLFLKKAWPSKNEKSEEGEAASFIEPLRVNIMTIHKSKGLKFNCVIVPGCGKDYKTNHQPMELSPDGFFAVQVLSNESEEKISPLALRVLKEQRTQRELAESRRLFYVAVTRAAKRLSLISEKSFSAKSWFGKMKIDLSQGDHKEGYFVKTWIEAPQNKSWSPEIKKLNLSQDFIERIKLKSPHVVPMKEPLDTTVDLKILLKSQQRGIIMHAVFEEIKRHPHLDLKEVIRLTLSRFHVEDLEDQTIIEKTMSMNTPPMADIFRNGHAEWSFSFMQNNKVYSGRIDLWGTVGDTTWIIDYKSAKQLSNILKQSVKEQLEFYALALNKTGIPWNKIRLAAILPQTQEVFEPKLGDRSEVESLTLNVSRYLDRMLRDQNGEQVQIQ